MYKINTLEVTRYSLNRYLKSPPVQKTFEIIKTKNIMKQCFKTAITDLKGTTEHHLIMSEEDRKTIYSSIHTSPNTPFDLYNKVQWDIRL